MIEKFKADIQKGLSGNPKTLPSKYFYDAIGDKLFVDIMNMPEYYLTRSEFEIFYKQHGDLINSFDKDPNTPFELIELGAGDGTKTIELLKGLLDRNYNFNYSPIDISKNALEGLKAKLDNKLPELNVTTKQGDYFGILSSLDSSIPKVVLCLGSNLGNMNDQTAHIFMKKLADVLLPGDILLLGLDLIKSKEIVLPAYNDAAGITRKFNLNLLTRINRELGANFKLNCFEHVPEYDEKEGIATSSLMSTESQSVHISSLNQDFSFEEGEKIQTEISRKYNEDILNHIIRDTGLRIKGKFTDSNAYFADFILIKS